jgi:protein phosphatase PTC2/3
MTQSVKGIKDGYLNGVLPVT